MLVALASAGVAQLKITHKWLGEERPGITQKGQRTLGCYAPQLKGTLTELTKHAANKKDSVAAAAWRVLAFSGTGSSMRNGHQMKVMKSQLLVLTARVAYKDEVPPPRGRITRSEECLANLAIVRCQREANYKLLRKYVARGLERLLKRFPEQDTAAPTAEETLYLTLLADSLIKTRWDVQGQTFLELAQRGVAATPPGKSRFYDAMRHFLALIAGEKEIDPELTTALCWPGDPLKAPLHAFLGAYTLRVMPPNVRAAHWPYAQRLLQRREKGQLWPAATNFDRKTTASIMTAIVGMSFGKSGALPLGYTPPKKEDPWKHPFR